MQKSKILAIILSLMCLAGIILMVKKTPPMPADMKKSAAIEGIEIKDIVKGNGHELTPGKKAIFHYEAKLEDGKVFDSSLRGLRNPMTVTLGQGHIPKGLDQALIGLRVGGKHIISLKPEKAYGAKGIPGIIPPNSAVTFEVNILGIKE